VVDAMPSRVFFGRSGVVVTLGLCIGWCSTMKSYWFHHCWRRHCPAGDYQRIGGYDVIAAVIDDLFAILHDDPGFVRFFGGRSADSVIRSRQLLVDQMCALSGGPCHHIGREMKESRGCRASQKRC
jgi:hypothetical protein